MKTSMKINILGFIFALMFSLVACDNTGSRRTSSDGVVVMSLGAEYEILPGDVITPEDENTQIEVLHVFGAGEDGGDLKFVTLISGSAKLIKGDYQKL
ncbi:hypothetical protein SAMN05660860_02844 [Geoalkalibacter ferrihydriticus]|uniref:Lipoprotein n=3 Tax=Geoalkalibacter ferrihydriticus TaxID=392333 RepID=A0A0C2HLZ4_9BACT|nr:hypothetical protein GFER_14000 [Geoalkalibacter ferrihydriticus DSM 17813]SDM59655.1 hypothetical protein SAMN05660860_02844 [Geoalkalibacter ferrihydriticus]